MTTQISGTREWAAVTVNCLTGCPHGCRYCYARERAVRFGQVRDAEAWRQPVVRAKQLTKTRQRVDGMVMFPSTHDITPEFLQPCLTVMENILRAGNRLLIVSKPHYECIAEICRRFEDYRDSILFRFTIGAQRELILAYWEPDAPSFAERLSCLVLTYRKGFGTSVSAEPLLESHNVVGLFAELEPYITDTFWIGKLNKIRSRVLPDTDPTEVRRIEAGQTDAVVRAVYAVLKDEPKIRWKDSYRKVLGLEERPLGV